MTDQEIIEVIQAKSNGRKIQKRVLGSCGSWEDDPDPKWAFCGFEYRVKPEPMVRYFVEKHGSLIVGHCISKCDADNIAMSFGGRVVKFVEEVE